MKQIELTKGKFAIVDDEDFEYINQWSWYAYKHRNTFYARRDVFINGKRTSSIVMHRVIMGCEIKGDKIIDHKDRDGLNNQKQNLRFATESQNAINRIGRGASVYRGVYKYTTTKRGKKYTYWAANIGIKGMALYLGSFPYTEEGERMAALVYNEHAKKHHGEFANLNIIT